VVVYCLSFNLQYVVSFDRMSMSFEAIKYGKLTSLDELKAAQRRLRESWKKIQASSSKMSEESVKEIGRFIVVNAEYLATVKRLQAGNLILSFYCFVGWHVFSQFVFMFILRMCFHDTVL